MNRSGYQPISQAIDEEADIGDGVQRSPSSRRFSRGLRRAARPGHIDLKHLDNAFKRLVGIRIVDMIQVMDQDPMSGGRSQSLRK